MIPVEVDLTPVNFTVGRQGNEIELVVFHWWGTPANYRMPRAHNAVVTYFHTDRETDDDGIDDMGSSAHVVASYQKRTRVVLDKDTAWHAGNYPVNLRSVGIELMPFDEITPTEQVRGTFIAGAESVACWLAENPKLVWDIHKNVSLKGTSCPGNWERLIPEMWAYALDLVPFVQADGTIAADAPRYEGILTMRSPVSNSRVTSPYGPRDLAVSPFHAGMDFAASGGTPVVAAFAGVAEHVVTNRVPDPKNLGLNNGKPTWAPGRSSNGLRIRGFVAGAEGYGHIRPVVTNGQTVTEGQIIGYVEDPASGIATGPHLHFETWAHADDPGSHFDPMVLFRKYGVTPGSGSSTAPSGAMETVQRNLQATVDPGTGKPFYSGLPDGVVGPIHLSAVKAWQRFRGLLADGDWGAKTQADWEGAWVPHVRDMWRKLGSLGYSVGADDGLFGPMMLSAVKSFQTDAGLVRDGVWGPVTEAAFQARVAPPAPVEPTPPPAPVEPTPPPAPVEPPAAAGTPILGPKGGSIPAYQARAREIGASTLFVEEMLPALHDAAVIHGIDPAVLIGQAGHETGWGNFGRAVTPDHHNTCGLKVRNPVGPDDNPEDHARFASWFEGAMAHSQHLYAYMTKPLPAGEANIDPRWDWVFPKDHRVTTVEELGGKWAPSPEYGVRVAETANRFRNLVEPPIVEPTPPPAPVEPTPPPAPVEPTPPPTTTQPTITIDAGDTLITIVISKKGNPE